MSKKETKPKEKKVIELTPIEFQQINNQMIHYFVCSDRKAAKEFFRQRFDIDTPCSGEGLSYLREGEHPVVWLVNKQVDTIVHEMTHAVLHVFQNIGSKNHIDPFGEFFPYYLEYAVNQVLKKPTKNKGNLKD